MFSLLRRPSQRRGDPESVKQAQRDNEPSPPAETSEPAVQPAVQATGISEFEGISIYACLLTL